MTRISEHEYRGHRIVLYRDAQGMVTKTEVYKDGALVASRDQVDTRHRARANARIWVDRRIGNRELRPGMSTWDTHAPA